MQNFVSTEILPEAQGLSTAVLLEAERFIPGSLHYVARRVTKPATWMGDEKAQLRYRYEPSVPAKNSLELRFCLIGNAYCKRFRNECNQCKAHLSEACEAKVESIDFVSLSFSPSLLEQFAKDRTTSSALSEKLLSFQYPSSFTRTVTLCGKTRVLLEGLLNHNYTGSLENIFVSAQSSLLLLNTLDCMDDRELDVINCKFLSNEADREKVLKAKEIWCSKLASPLPSSSSAAKWP